MFLEKVPNRYFTNKSFHQILDIQFYSYFHLYDDALFCDTEGSKKF